MIGVLAIQGDFAAHGKILSKLDAHWQEVRNIFQLADVSGLILPGGESTTMLTILTESGWMSALKDFSARGGCLFGTCAGAILLAREVANPSQESLGLMDISISRNAYGRQIHSFIATGPSSFGPPDLEMVFIRAPRVERAGPETKILAEYGGFAVLIQEGRNLLATFHPELTLDDRIHRHFLSMVSINRRKHESQSVFA